MRILRLFLKGRYYVLLSVTVVVCACSNSEQDANLSPDQTRQICRSFAHDANRLVAGLFREQANQGESADTSIIQLAVFSKSSLGTLKDKSQDCSFYAALHGINSFEIYDDLIVSFGVMHNYVEIYSTLNSTEQRLFLSEEMDKEAQKFILMTNDLLLAE